MRNQGFIRALLGTIFASMGCTLRRHPLPELREVGQEWLARPRA